MLCKNIFHISDNHIYIQTYFSGEIPIIIKIQKIGDTKNAEKLAHFIFKDYRLGNSEWFCFGEQTDYLSILDVVNYQFSYISYYYPTTIEYLKYINKTLKHDGYINLISNIDKILKNS